MIENASACGENMRMPARPTYCMKVKVRFQFDQLQLVLACNYHLLPAGGSITKHYDDH